VVALGFQEYDLPPSDPLPTAPLVLGRGARHQQVANYLRLRPETRSGANVAARDAARLLAIQRALGPGYVRVADVAMGETAGVCARPASNLKASLKESRAGGDAPSDAPNPALPLSAAAASAELSAETALDSSAAGAAPPPAVRSLAWQPSAAEVERWPACLAWDRDKVHGVLTCQDLEAMAVGQGFTKRQGGALFRCLDADGNGVLDYREFAVIYEERGIQEPAFVAMAREMGLTEVSLFVAFARLSVFLVMSSPLSACLFAGGGRAALSDARRGQQRHPGLQ
jgi:hypothetical protein